MAERIYPSADPRPPPPTQIIAFNSPSPSSPQPHLSFPSLSLLPRSGVSHRLSASYSISRLASPVHNVLFISLRTPFATTRIQPWNIHRPTLLSGRKFSAPTHTSLLSPSHSTGFNYRRRFIDKIWLRNDSRQPVGIKVSEINGKRFAIVFRRFEITVLNITVSN